MDTEESVFLIIQVWLRPGSFDRLKSYRMKTLDVLEKYNAEFVFHNHPFEQVSGPMEGAIPDGMEVIRFPTEDLARSMLADLESAELKSMESEVFSKVQIYLSRYAPPEKIRETITDLPALYQ